MTKLSEKQRQALDKMQPGKWYCAYDLQVSIATLEALARRGVVECKSGLGAIYSPRTNVKFKKVD